MLVRTIGIGILNILMVLLLAPLFEGVVRKYIKARVAHSRKGPPIIQPFLDLFKLLGKEDLQVSSDWLFRWSPVICFGATLCAALLAPMGTDPPLGSSGDFIVFVYVVGISAIAMIMGGMTSSSPYAYAGATREMMMFLIVEPVLVIVLIAAAVNSHSLKFSDMIAWHSTHAPSFSMAIGAFALLLALQAQFGKLPFGIPEADQEIIGGPFIEMSGPKLALFRWAVLARQFIFSSVLATVFIPLQTSILAINIVLNVAKVFVLMVLVGLVEVVNPRLRIDQALAFFLGIIFVALGAVILAFVAV